MKFVSLLLIFFMNVFMIPAAPVSAASAPIGQMLTTGSTAATKVETTLFNGDMVETLAGQHAAVTLRSAGILNFNPDSTARIEQTAGAYRVDLKKGTVSFASMKLSRQILTIQAAGVEVVVPEGTSARGRVMSNRDAVVVTALQGNLQISDSERVLSLAEGETAEMPISPSSPRAGQGSSGPAAGLIVYPTKETDILAGHTFVIKAQLLDAAGNPVNAAGIPVTFSLAAGACKGGTPSSLLTQSGVTDSFGIVSVTLRVCTVEGNVDTVSVSSPGLTGATTANLDSVKRKKAGAAAGAGVGGGGLFGWGWAATAALFVGIGTATGIIIYETTQSQPQASPVRP
jgi:ferric-dicitrate binding protein FerR (iron transport regulator)